MNLFLKLKLKNMSAEEAYREGERLFDSNQKDKSFPYYLHAAQNDHGRAQHMTALCYSNGYGCDKNDKQAQYWWERAAEKGNPTSQYLCAQTYESGKFCIRDAKKALYWYEKAAEQAKPGQMYGSVSVYTCAIAYERGRGCVVDLERALYWYEKCRELHLKDAENYEKRDSHKAMLRARESVARVHEDVNRVRAALGLAPESLPMMEHETDTSIARAERLLAEGMECLVREPEKACGLLKQAAELRNCEAQYQYGQLLRYGRGCQQDTRAALRMLEKAAEQRHVLAQQQLGLIYFYGRECPKNRTAAHIWFDNAAEQNDPESIYHLGLLEIHRWMGTDGYNKTRVYLNRAAYLGHVEAKNKQDLLDQVCSGDPEAMYHLALFIIEVGDPYDEFNSARYWLYKAEEKGHIGARLAQNTVAKGLPYR